MNRLSLSPSSSSWNDEGGIGKVQYQRLSFFQILSFSILTMIAQWPERVRWLLDTRNIVDGSPSDGDNLWYLNYYKRVTHLNESLNSIFFTFTLNTWDQASPVTPFHTKVSTIWAFETKKPTTGQFCYIHTSCCFVVLYHCLRREKRWRHSAFFFYELNVEFDPPTHITFENSELQVWIVHLFHPFVLPLWQHRVNAKDQVAVVCVSSRL